MKKFRDWLEQDLGLYEIWEQHKSVFYSHQNGEVLEHYYCHGSMSFTYQKVVARIPPGYLCDDIPLSWNARGEPDYHEECLYTPHERIHLDALLNHPAARLQLFQQLLRQGIR